METECVYESSDAAISPEYFTKVFFCPSSFFVSEIRQLISSQFCTGVRSRDLIIKFNFGQCQSQLHYIAPLHHYWKFLILCAAISDVSFLFNLLKPSGNFTYHQV
jgi:hypothetical protein